MVQIDSLPAGGAWPAPDRGNGGAAAPSSSAGGEVVRVPASISDTLREIAGRYDLTHITPREFSELLDELHGAGSIDGAQLRQLSLVRIDLDRAGVPADEAVDLLDVLSERVDELQHSVDRLARRTTSEAELVEATGKLDVARANLQWVQRLALAGSRRDPGSFDAFA